MAYFKRRLYAYFDMSFTLFRHHKVRYYFDKITYHKRYFFNTLCKLNVTD